MSDAYDSSSGAYAARHPHAYAYPSSRHDHNDFRGGYAQDGGSAGGFSSGVGGAAGAGAGAGSGGGAGGHWPQSYAGYASSQNQFAGAGQTNGSSHPSYSSYGAHPNHYSAFSLQQQQQQQQQQQSQQQQQQAAQHSRPAHMHLGSASQGYGSHHHGESGPPTPSSANMSQHNTPGASLGASGAYHSSSMAGMMPGMGHHSGAAHQGYPSHYSASMMPQTGNAVGMGGQAHHLNAPGAMSSPGYPSAPQYSTQLPMAGRHRVTTTLWEDEGTLCFQVDAKGVCVARRHDNNMINGTKLLNVCGMSRGKRDGILKNEKERIVVKVGAMHLKGVWITFQRGKQLADQNGISELLYPLFEPNIQAFLYTPDNYPRTAAVMAAAQERQAKRGPETASPSTTMNNSYDSAHDHASWARHPSSAYMSAPNTAAQSPSHGGHHTASGYSTPALHQQSGTPSSAMGSSHSLSGMNGATAASMRSTAGIPGSLPADRRHSMPLGEHMNASNRPGPHHSPYHNGASSGLASNSVDHAAAAALAGAGGHAGRRAVSGAKRAYDDGPDGHEGSTGSAYSSGGYGMGSGPGGPAGASSQSNSLADRSYKRMKDERDFGSAAHDTSSSFDTSGSGDGAAGSSHGHPYGNGRGMHAPDQRLSAK